MRHIILIFSLLSFINHSAYAQEKSNDKQAITLLINTYSKAVINKDSTAFYDLFNDGPVVWCGALAPLSLQKENIRSGKAADGYFSGSYKSFMRGLFKYQSTEDKFDNVRIIEDGTVSSVTMDYSFWANGKMTNWGRKLLTLIKRSGTWKITSVSYSIQLTEYSPQPPLKKRSTL